jgi:hypothetical protein
MAFVRLAPVLVDAPAKYRDDRFDTHIELRVAASVDFFCAM